ncbi:MAG: aminotransferase class V-fold PLP-dependent enzyme [Bacteroidia bacterium]
MTVLAPDSKLLDKAYHLRQDFPILATPHPSGNPLVYLDNAATTQKPLPVLEALQRYYTSHNANIHRGVHYLSTSATELYEKARKKVQRFIGAAHADEIIFVKGATEGINLIAHGLKQVYFQPGDQILISPLEHHANIVPWHLIAQEKPIALRTIPLYPDASVNLDALYEIDPTPIKLVSIVHMSNTLGSYTPLEEIIQWAKSHHIPVLVDICQSIAHTKIDVEKWGIDFAVFSGHKIYGPTGIGVAYLKRPWAEKLPPYQGGGDMIKRVRIEGSTYADPPAKFEAGTPPIAQAIGLAAALEYFEKQVTYEFAQAYEDALLHYATEKITELLPKIQILGPKAPKGPILSLHIEELHPHDIGTFLDTQGIAVRTGHHCTQPLMDFLNVVATTRASLSFYNTPQEIDTLIHALRKTLTYFGL